MRALQPPWRYIAVALLVSFLATLYLLAPSNSYPPSPIVTSTASHLANRELIQDVFNSTLGKVLVVSLPERTDRRDGLILGSAASDIDITFIDASHGEGIPEKAVPTGGGYALGPNTVGSWRAHMNAISSVVHNKYASALIMEDDVDWDIRLKTLLHDFAISNHALAQNPNQFDALDFHHLPNATAPTLTPYGDDWDLLWLGHCGMQVPETGLLINYNDSSVPEFYNMASAAGDQATAVGRDHPHMRLVLHQSKEPVCSLAYAVSQRGARSLLYNLGLRQFDTPFDIMLRAWCQGRDGNEVHRCPGVIPQLFSHHRRAGPVSVDSDLNAPIQGYRAVSATENVRWSVRLNIEKMIKGETDYYDQYPDVVRSLGDEELAER